MPWPVGKTIGGQLLAVRYMRLRIRSCRWLNTSCGPESWSAMHQQRMQNGLLHTHKLHNIRVVLHTYCTYSFIDGSISAEYTIARYHWWSHCWWVWPFWRWGKLNWLWWKSNWWMVFDDVKVSRFGDGLGYVHRPKHGDGFLFKARLVLTCVQNAMDGMVWV